MKAENLLRVGSSSIGPAEWLQLAQRIDALLSSAQPPQGVVITHGTATLEETGYFLHLTVKSDRPVVLTGAMRPPSALGTDADLNLVDAIRLAACPDAAGRGVLTVLNNEIQSARDVTKTNAFRVNTFGSRDFGCLGYVDADGQVLFYRNVTRLHTSATPFDVRGRQTLPRVDIVYAYAGADGVLIDALRERGTDGLVLDRIRRRHLSRRLPRGRQARSAGGHPRGARHPLHRRARRHDARKGGRGLHRVGRPDAAEGAHPIDAGAEHHPRAPGHPGDVLPVLSRHGRQTTAMQSISTSNFFGHDPTVQNTRAGGLRLKYFRYTSFTSSKYAALVM